MDKLLTNYLEEKWRLYKKNKWHLDFHTALNEYLDLKSFKISENVETVGGISEEAHFIMRMTSQYYMEKVFESMKIDMSDGNVTGDKGTPYRVIKTWTGADLDDSTELMSGRWNNRPNITCFENENSKNFPITKRIDIVSVCSHHLAPFSSMFRTDAYAIVSYIPSKKVLGISKLQRLVDWCGRRGHLQENLTQLIYDEVSKACETESVFVKLYNIVHTCEKLRGTQSDDGAFISEYYGGDFNNPELRKQVNS